MTSSDEALVCYGDGAEPNRPAGSPRSYARGGSMRWTPETIADIHAKSQLGRYQLRGFSTFQRNLPDFDDLVFQPATMTRLPLEGYRESCATKTVFGDGLGKCEQPIELDIPIYIGSMSFGALSASAKAALGKGASRAGTMTCTGEGGMLPEERENSRTLVYQLSPARYGLDLEHLRLANGLEVVVGQGAKPGTGGLLLGMKVSERVANMRNLPMGADQIPDFRRLSSVLMQRTGWQMVRTQPAVGNFQVTGRVPNSVECCWPFRASTLPEHMATIWTGTQGRRGAPLMLTCLGPGP